MFPFQYTRTRTPPTHALFIRFLVSLCVCVCTRIYVNMCLCEAPLREVTACR